MWSQEAQSKKHHRPDGFNNNYIDNWRPDQPGLLAWQRARWAKGLPAQDPTRVPIAMPDLTDQQANRSDLSVTWIGHSTALWQLGGLNILTDPHFTQRVSPICIEPAVSVQGMVKVSGPHMPADWDAASLLKP